MEQQKKCPACGEALAPGTAQCPNCQLEGLDQIFLSRADYDNWVSKVLKPHKGRISRRVFSDNDTLLILTGDGELYGMGENSSGEIVEDGGYYINEPVHMASNVISAAVGHYTVFVTEDGRVHIRGRGEFADRVPEFTDAREVFLYESQFYVVNRQGQLFVFGDNRDGSLEPKQDEQLMIFPRMSSKAIGPFYDSNAPFCYGTRHPSYDDQLYAECQVRNGVMKTEAYQAFAQRYEPSNLHILLEPAGTERCDTESVQYGSYTKYNQIYSFFPVLFLLNTYLHTPVLYHDQDFANTPHRVFSMPLQTDLFDTYPQIKKACVDCVWERAETMAICHDGTLVWFDRNENLHRLNWTKAPVHDLAVMCRPDKAVVSCKDGRLYLLDTRKLPEVEITGEITL